MDLLDVYVPLPSMNGVAAMMAGMGDDMDQLRRLLAFLDRLDQAGLTYTLAHTRPESLRVDVATPGERWEIEFMADGGVEIERFKSAGGVDTDPTLLDALFRDV